MSWPRDPHPEGAPDPSHVADLSIDFAEGRLDAATSQRVQAHLEGCAECRADIEFARRLRQQTLAARLRHVAPERLVLLAENPALGPTDDEFAHMEACELCRRQLDWARSLPLPAELQREAAARAPIGAAAAVPSAPAPQATSTAARRFRLRPAVVWRWGAVIAAAAALVLLLRPSAPEQQVQQAASLAALARIEPLPVRLQRAGGNAEDFDGLFARGLSAYRDGDYAAAVEALGRAAGLNDQDPSAHLYLGSALLQLGRSGEALPHLQRAAELSDASSLLDAAQWLLANACLRLEDRACATQRLRAVASLGGAHAAAARGLLQAVGAR